MTSETEKPVQNRTPPRLIYAPAPCPRCGALTVDQAGEMSGQTAERAMSAEVVEGMLQTASGAELDRIAEILGHGPRAAGEPDDRFRARMIRRNP